MCVRVKEHACLHACLRVHTFVCESVCLCLRVCVPFHAIGVQSLCLCACSVLCGCACVPLHAIDSQSLSVHMQIRPFECVSVILHHLSQFLIFEEQCIPFAGGFCSASLSHHLGRSDDTLRK